jgi:hypothetical protein
MGLPPVIRIDAPDRDGAAAYKAREEHLRHLSSEDAP